MDTVGRPRNLTLITFAVMIGIALATGQYQSSGGYGGSQSGYGGGGGYGKGNGKGYGGQYGGGYGAIPGGYRAVTSLPHSGHYPGDYIPGYGGKQPRYGQGGYSTGGYGGGNQGGYATYY
ncbi:hypothetical protein MTO96_015205 [Rhipicephalus appendiculatus]